MLYFYRDSSTVAGETSLRDSERTSDFKMERRTILIGLLVFLFITVDCEPRKRGGWGGGWGSSSSKGKSQSRQTTNTRSQTHGSQPGKIGWNPPPRNSNPPPKPSAPVQDHVQKSSATQVHSGYPNNGRGYNRNGVQNNRSPQLQNNRSPQYQYNRPTQYQYNRPQFQNSRAGQQHYPQQSAYNPNSRPPPYSPPGTSPYGSHSNPYGGGYHPQSGGYHPQSNGYHAPGYNLGHSSVPGAGYNPTVGNPQPVILQSQPYKPGIGQLAKEAFVFAGVSAGVNAAVNRIIPGGIYGNGGSVWGGSSHSGSGVNPAGVPGVTNTHITYNNYYNNGTNPETGAPMPGVDPATSGAGAPAAAPVSSAGAPPADAANQPPPPPPQDPGFPPSPSGYVVTNEDLQKLAEDMYSKETNNAYKDITMNLQGHKMDASSTDDASAPLLTVKSEAYELPTVKNVVALLDNYELDVKTKENVTPDERREEDALLDTFLATDVMKTAMKYLSDKGYIANDEYEFKDALKRIWFSQFKRIDGEPSSSGFETVFLAEQFDSEIIGLHNWIYFAKQEEASKLNYLGYIKKAELGSNGAIVKVRLQLNNVLQPLTTVFVGTSPELEMALYTVCFYIRPNSVCPVALGGTNFMIVANRVNYFGKDILVSAYPEI